MINFPRSIVNPKYDLFFSLCSGHPLYKAGVQMIPVGDNSTEKTTGGTEYRCKTVCK